MVQAEMEMKLCGRDGGLGGLTMRSASALRFSKGCSSLNLDRMMKAVSGGYVAGRGDEAVVMKREGRVLEEDEL